MALKIVQIFILLLVINTALSTICYQCNSKENGLCPYRLAWFSFNTVDCKGLFSKCGTIVVKDENGYKDTARGCFPTLGLGQTGCNAILRTVFAFSSVEEVNCSPCDEHKCNSVMKYTGHTMFGVILVAGTFLF